MVDILIEHGFVLTMRGEGVGMIEDGAVAIEEDEIIDVGKTHRLRKRYKEAETVFDARMKAVLPGFVDAHMHTPLTLIRGEAQDVPELEWMIKTIDPFSRHVKPNDRVKGSALGVLEGIKSGTTCFSEVEEDMTLLAEEAFTPSGVRACLAETINEIGPHSRPDAHKPYQLVSEIGERKLKKGLQFAEEFHGTAEGRITCMLAPHAADMMGLELLLRVKEEASRLGLKMHMHVAQGGREAIQMKLRYQKTTIGYLHENGLLDESLLAAHCHHSTDEELATLAENGVSYVSCPSSIGLIDGVTPPLAQYLAFGGRAAALGSDQASGNNCHNMLMEMKIAALLNKTRHRDPTVLPAWKTLRIATLEGARALGLDGHIGSLEPGKKADLIILGLQAPHMRPVITKPVRNIAPNIVYSARGDEVETSIINGKVIMENRRILTLDEDRVIHAAQEAAERVTRQSVEDFISAGSQLVDAVRKGLL